MRPEVELILLCARLTLDSPQVEKLQQLVQQPLDWEYVQALIERHSLQPLVGRNLQTHCAAHTPADLLAQLGAQHQQTALLNLQRVSQLLTLLSQLEGVGIRALPYKGPVLAQQLYGDIALRRSGDLDILVHQADVAGATEVLQAAGFVQSWPEPPLTPAQQRLHLATKYNYQFRHPVDDLVLELHWTITPNYLHCPPRRKWLWDRLHHLSLAGRQVPVFPPEELLLILCIHASNHCWIALNWVADIAQLLERHPTLDWDYLRQLAQRWHSQRMLGMGLYLSHTLFGSNLPAEVWASISADATILKLAKPTRERLFAPHYRFFRPFEEPLYHLRLRERWQDRLRYCLAVLTPTVKDLAFLPLPTFLYFLYFPLRLIRLCVEHGIQLWRRV